MHRLGRRRPPVLGTTSACSTSSATATRRRLPAVRLQLLGRTGRDHAVAAIGRAARSSTKLAPLDDAAVRARPAPDVWSPLEYACHVRDVLRRADRARRARAARGRARVRPDGTRRTRRRRSLQRAGSGSSSPRNCSTPAEMLRHAARRPRRRRLGTHRACTTIPSPRSVRSNGSRSTPRTSSCTTGLGDGRVRQVRSGPWRSRGRCSCAPSRSGRRRRPTSGSA